MSDRPHPPVLWTRGQGCAELAALLADSEPVRVVGDLSEACVATRAELLVGRKLPGGFDLVSVVVPVDFEPARVKSVVAAVAGGPHSALAARIAERLGASLGVPASMAAAYRDPDGQGEALAVIERLVRLVPGLEYRTMEVADIPALVAGLSSQALLVFGAPGGNWFQRLAFGPGARLRQQAAAGAVIVRQASSRVFQVMEEPVYVAPLREAGDALRIHPEAAIAVVDEGMLVGLVRRPALLVAPAGTAVGEVMDEPLAIDQLEPVAEAERLRPLFVDAPIPVTDERRHMVGSLYLPAA